jgi:hypothetical protein
VRGPEVLRIIRRHLRGEMRRVSIGAIPKNYLMCQGNPGNHPCRAHGGAMGSVFKDDFDKGEESCSQPCERVFKNRPCDLSESNMMKDFGQ